MHSEAAIRVCLRPGAYARRRNAALSTFQAADVGTVRTPLRKSLVCAHSGIVVRSLPEETGEPCRSQVIFDHIGRRQIVLPLLPRW